MKDRNWWDTTISYEEIVYDYLLTSESYETIPKEVIEFAAMIMKTSIAELAEYLKKKYEEE